MTTLDFANRLAEQWARDLGVPDHFLVMPVTNDPAPASVWNSKEYDAWPDRCPRQAVVYDWDEATGALVEVVIMRERKRDAGPMLEFTIRDGWGWGVEKLARWPDKETTT